MKRVLVFGAAGQVARALVVRGTLAGWNVTALGRAQFDLAHLASIPDKIAEIAPDAIVNAAAFTAVDKAESEPEAAAHLNGIVPGAIAAAAAAMDLPFVHLSTDYVFDGEGAVPYREVDATVPLGVYGRTKRSGEIVAFKAGGRCVILRTSWVFAPWGTNFVRTMLRLATRQERLRVVDDQRGGPTSAIDIADAVLTILGRQLDGMAGKDSLGLFHYQGRPPTSWAGFAEAVLDEGAIRGHPRPPVDRIATADYPLPAKRPLWGVLDCSRISREYDITPPDWRRRLPETIERILADGF